MITLTEHFHAAAGVLEKFPTVEVTAIVEGPVDSQIVTQVQNLIGQPLNPELLSLYQEANGFQLDWRIPQTSGPAAFGTIQFASLEEAIGGRHKLLSKSEHRDAHEEILWNDNSTSREISQMKDYKLIEALWGTNLAAVYNYKRKPISSTIEIAEGGIVHSCPLTFSQYLHFILDSFCLPSVRFDLLEKDPRAALSINSEITAFETKFNVSIRGKLLTYFE